MRKFLSRTLHSGGQKPGAEHDQQPNNQQSQLQERGSGKDSPKAQQQPASIRNTLGSLYPFKKNTRSDPKATATGHARPPSQSDSVVSGTLAPVNGRIKLAASSSSLIPPGGDPVLPSGESQVSSATPTHPPPDPTGLGGGDHIMPHVHCSPPPQETTSAGSPEVSATTIPASNPADIVINTIAPVNPSPQSPGPVSAPASDPEALSSTPQANNSPSTVPPSIASHLWQKALEIAQGSLAKYQLPSLEPGGSQSESAADNIQSLVAELETAHQQNKDRRWRYKDRDGNEVVWVERLGKVLKSVNKYATIVDIAIQHHPDITSLVWAGARTMLQVCPGLLERSSSLIYGRLL